jgi:HPt (histidine-containing phosphotransfer) domain-containing protein
MNAPSHDDTVRADLDFWRDLAEGDDDSARELLALYLEDTSAHISLMISGLAAGRADEVARAAHTCAGSSSTCGLDALAGMFRQLEYEARDHKLDDLSHTLPRIVETFDQVHARLTRAIAASSSAPIEERT